MNAIPKSRQIRKKHNISFSSSFIARQSITEWNEKSAELSL